ncbi:hypothetical protein [Streptomyces sp. NPDC058664]|uniref:hypothetical protein n=1 Tax=unclassified Streptomyces TaxID=2593676 RepID=UPI00365028E2
MNHRTHPTQQDEALRQARLDSVVRESLRLIADTLTHVQPNQLMDASHRLHLAYTVANEIHRDTPGAAAELEHKLLLRMPWVDGRAVTRGEYALWLHKTSWSA